MAGVPAREEGSFDIFLYSVDLGTMQRALMETGLRKPLSFNTLDATGGDGAHAPQNRPPLCDASALPFLVISIQG